MCAPKTTISVPEIQGETDIIFCHFGPFFPPFTPSNNQQNQHFEKMKKASGDVIVLHMCQCRTQSFFGHAGRCDGTRKTLMKV